jgi:hypothetical protein
MSLKGNSKAAALSILLGCAALAAGCGTDDPATTTQGVSKATANQLADLSEQVATELDSGDTCSAAHSADDLSQAIADANLPAQVRSQSEEVADRLVAEVNCPEPVVTTTTETKTKEEKPDDHGDHPGEIHIPPGHGGTPPGHDHGHHGQEGGD